MTRVPIVAESHSYNAWIESGLLSRAGTVLRRLVPRQARLFVVTTQAVRRRWGATLVKSLATAGFETATIEMPDGERYKRLAAIEQLAEKLVGLGADRDSVIVALGGGVTGDVAGLLASLYMRGVGLVQVPTTLLAQVDASVGGKTGVNLKSGKNLLGTFYPPRAVLIDPAVLATLPKREFRAGLYEALKCGVIGNASLFRLFEQKRAEVIGRDPETMERVIKASVRLKARVVAADEREQGLRRVLNFGHTIGHALEAETGYRKLLHGEAVAWGMIAAAHIALEMGMAKQLTCERITAAVRGLGRLPRVSVSGPRILGRLKADKKTRSGAIHFVLPLEIGRVEIVTGVPQSAVLSAVDAVRRLSELN